MSQSEEMEKVRADAAWFRRGWAQRLATHKILNPKVYAENQGKQTKLTEAVLLDRRTGKQGDDEEQSVEIIHKGDTRPLIFARQVGTTQTIRGEKSKRERDGESKKRSGDIFLSAGRYEAALATYVDALKIFDEGTFAIEARLAASDAAFKSGDPDKAEEFADIALQRIGDDDSYCDALRLRRAVARLARKKWLLAENDLVRGCVYIVCVCPSPTIKSTRPKTSPEDQLL